MSGVSGAPRRNEFAGKDAATIERTNDETRARMSETMGALRGRLTPSEMLEQAAAYLRTANGTQFTRNFGAQVRDNPMPAAVTGIGLAWLMATNGRRGSGTGHGVTQPGVAHQGMMHQGAALYHKAVEAGMAVMRRPGDADHEHRARVDEAHGGVLGIERRADEPAAGYSSRIDDAMTAAKSWAGQMQESASGGLSAASGQMGALGGQARDGARGMAATIAGNPMLLGALGVTAGAVLGALLPHIDAEDALLGDAARQLSQAAREAVEEVVETGEHVVGATSDAVRQAAEEQGLTTGQAADAGVGVTGRVRAVAEAGLKAGSGALKE